MQDGKGAAAVVPHQEHHILVFGNVAELALHIRRALHGMAIHFLNHHSTRQAGVVCRASWFDVADNRSVNFIWNLQLLANVRRQAAQPKAPTGFAMLRPSSRSYFGSIHLFQSDRNAHLLAIPDDLHIDLGSRTFFADQHLQLSSVADLLSVYLSYYVANFQPSPASR